ncbi:MAG: recombinase family protein, partial [Oscillospiraceae bacterium]|nr:recombinase family protein [Oscillospiraceae bacterium]
MINYVIALYIRLSVEDSKTDSLSIHNQRLMLHHYADALPEADNAEILEFVDNGHSGANFERPAVQELLELVRQNKIDCIIVKDFTRFGRNSIDTGYFIERVFPLYRTRFISVQDDFDTLNFKEDTGGMEVAFKYLISEYYSKDLSEKSRSAKYMKMQRGEYQSKICHYGYVKGAGNRLEIDEEAAAVVRLIFDLSLAGQDARQITGELYTRGIPTPGEYKAQRGMNYHDISRCHHMWQRSQVLRILYDERYTGTYIIGKRAVREVGGSRMRLKPESEWFKIPDHHPAIIDKAVYEQVQAGLRRYVCEKKNRTEYPLRCKVFCG